MEDHGEDLAFVHRTQTQSVNHTIKCQFRNREGLLLRYMIYRGLKFLNVLAGSLLSLRSLTSFATPVHALTFQQRFAVTVQFTAMCLVTWPLSGSEAGVDLVLMQTLLLFICKYKLVSMRTT